LTEVGIRLPAVHTIRDIGPFSGFAVRKQELPMRSICPRSRADRT
jgi:hypothetical protein